jgi:hypothetical protein
MTNDLKEDYNKQMHKVRKSIHDLDKKLSNVDEKLSKEVRILKRKTNGNVGN